MRVTLADRLGRGQGKAAEEFDGARLGLGAGGQAMDQQRLDHLRHDRARGVEGGGGALRDIGDAMAAHAAQGGLVHRLHIDIAYAEGIGLDRRAEAGIAHQRERDGGLARAGFADQRQHFARRNGEGDVLDDDLAGAVRLLDEDRETFDSNGGAGVDGHVHRQRHALPPGLSASIRRLAPTVRVAMASAGTMIAGAPCGRPEMFSRTSEPRSA